jgi:hypothetical protein
MQRPRLLPSLRALAAVALLPILMAPVTADTHCAKRDSWTGCKSYTDFSLYPGTDYFCVKNHPVVQIESYAMCGGFVDGSTLVLRCGTNQLPFSYTGIAAIHTLGTTTSWEDILLTNTCAPLTYSAIYW